MAKLGLKEIDWLPAIDLRGEGIFLQLDATALSEWQKRAAVRREAARLAAQLDEWRQSRGMHERPFPGMRYVLLHTLAHVLIRQFALDCGYSSSALRERIYCETGTDPMAGLLIYTASSDSDGSLGGLVAEASPDRLGALLDSCRDRLWRAPGDGDGTGAVELAVWLMTVELHVREIREEVVEIDRVVAV